MIPTASGLAGEWAERTRQQAGEVLDKAKAELVAIAKEKAQKEPTPRKKGAQEKP